MCVQKLEDFSKRESEMAHSALQHITGAHPSLLDDLGEMWTESVHQVQMTVTGGGGGRSEHGGGSTKLKEFDSVFSDLHDDTDPV